MRHQRPARLQQFRDWVNNAPVWQPAVAALLLAVASLTGTVAVLRAGFSVQPGPGSSRRPRRTRRTRATRPARPHRRPRITRPSRPRLTRPARPRLTRPARPRLTRPARPRLTRPAAA